MSKNVLITVYIAHCTLVSHRNELSNAKQTGSGEGGSPNTLVGLKSFKNCNKQGNLTNEAEKEIEKSSLI